MTAQVTGDADGMLDEKTSFVLTVFRLPEDEYEESATVIGQSTLTGAEINSSPAIEVGNYKKLRFKLDVPVTADGDLLVLVSPYNIEGNDGIAIPYMRSEDDKIFGNSVVYMMVYENEENGGTYDTFYNLNYYPLSKGHFAGLIMALGASYSYMEAMPGANADIEMPCEGGSHTLDIRAMHGPDTWAVTADGVTKADWISCSALPKDGENDVYTATLTFDKNDSTDPRETDVYVAQAGSRVKLHVFQKGNMSGLEEMVAEKVSISVEGDDIIVSGDCCLAEVFNAAGEKVASAQVNSRTVISTAHLGNGVYIVCAGDARAKFVK